MDIYDGTIPILRLIEQDEQEAKRILIKFSDQRFSMFDAINFSVMKRVGIGKAFSFDAHFQIFGFEKIP
jgi:predicted nucleic acid-binding protein